MKLYKIYFIDHSCLYVVCDNPQKAQQLIEAARKAWGHDKENPATQIDILASDYRFEGYPTLLVHDQKETP